MREEGVSVQGGAAGPGEGLGGPKEDAANLSEDGGEMGVKEEQVKEPQKEQVKEVGVKEEQRRHKEAARLRLEADEATFFLSLLLSGFELSDTKVYEPSIQARLGTAAHF